MIPNTDCNDLIKIKKLKMYSVESGTIYVSNFNHVYADLFQGKSYGKNKALPPQKKIK